MAFSGYNFFVPERVEDYLKHLFGDYMQLPPKESQIKQMNSVLFASWNDANGNIVMIK